MATKKKSIKNFINKVFNDDIFNILKQLPDNSIDMIYGDPDYNVGIVYGGKNYTTDFENFIEWYINLNKECMRVLKDDGNIMMMNYPMPNAHLRAHYLEDAAFSIHEYVWVYNTNVGQSKKYFTTAHRSILHITKSKDNRFFKENVLEKYQNPGPVRQKLFKRRVIKELAKYEFKLRNQEEPDTKNLNEFIKKNGRALWGEINKGHIDNIKLTKSKRKIVEESWKKTDDEFDEKGRMPYSWFYNDLVKNVSKEKTIHAAQIPKDVSKKLIYASTEPGDNVLVLFGGSGSECEVCKEGGRNYISAELHDTYHDLIVKRLKEGKIPKEYYHNSRLPRKKKEATEDEKQTKLS